MRLLDRYVIRSFLHAALMWFLVMMALRTVIDLSVNIDDFARLHKPFWEMVSDIVSYYGYNQLVYFTELGGVVIVAAAAFTLAKMNQTNELTAMLASGVSLRRVVWPIVISAVLLGGLIVVDQEFIMPQCAAKLVRDMEDVPGVNDFPVRLIEDSNGSRWYSPSFKPPLNRMESPVVLIRKKDYRLIACINGASAEPATMDEFSEAGQDPQRIRGWMIRGGAQPASSTSQPAAAMPAGISPEDNSQTAWPNRPDSNTIWTQLGPAQIVESLVQHDPEQFKKIDVKGALLISNLTGVCDKQYGMEIRARRFLPEKADPAQKADRGGVLEEPRFIFTTGEGQCLGWIVASSARYVQHSADSDQHWTLTDGAIFYPSDLAPDDLRLRRSTRWLDFMSTSQLNQLLALQRVPDRSMAMLVKSVRITEPINNLVMLLLGLPFILSRERNIKASAGLTLLMVGTFYAFIYICRSMTGLPPAWSAWLPILLFGPVAVVMQDSVKT